ncbi:unnamed protein product [Caenorhabditis auriculariae]|uniref:THO complex subunit 2 n=1 Tax=Caenorhabditis auriculariae TaxID=2777116 RepID=A0A8S1H3M7_9PELO|nr:unnamed protein product [Caenorhabditis auriculariae]
MCDVYNDTDLFSSIYKICQDVIAGTQTAVLAFNQLSIFIDERKDTSSVLLDVLVTVEGEVHLAESRENAEKKFREFVALLFDTVIPEEVLRAELDCLDALKQEFKQQLIRTKTRLYFKQAKFNLLREESEGYSKLITELMEVNGNDPLQMSGIIKTRVLCLIGQFNLDPSRVIDIILECFESRPSEKAFFITLLKEINVVREYLCALLGFKYTFYQKSSKSTPYSLYVVTAELIRNDLLDILKVLAYMVPKTEAIKEGHRARASNGQARASKAETISTASIPVESSSVRNLEDAGSLGPSTMIQSVSFATVTAQQEADDLKLAENFTENVSLATNQKLGVACALLEAGSWLHAQPLLDRLPEYYAVQSSPRLCRALCELIEKAIDDFYLKRCSRRFHQSKKDLCAGFDGDVAAQQGLSKVTSWKELADLSSVLWYLGPRIAYSPKMTVKLLRLITDFYKKGEEDEDVLISRTFMDIIEECLLPSLTLSETNAALSEELWLLLQIFPYSWRYRLYGRWSQQSVRHPEINIARGKVLGKTRYVLKRLSKETVKVIGRQLGKQCHIHPMTVLDYLLSQVQTFDNFIGPIVDGLKFLTNLELDVLTYCIVTQLADPAKNQLKASDATLSPWLQALGTFVGSVYKRYTLELNGILDLVANQLKCCKSVDLLLLREVIQSMSWVESSTAATQEHVEALSGGEVLRQEAGGYSNAKNKRASQRLRDSLLTGDLATGMCILVAQQRDHVIFEDSKTLPLKLVGELVDQCSDTLQQLGTFLLSYIKADEYTRRIPPLHRLLSEYFLRLDAAMYLSRPTFIPKVIEAYDEEKKKVRANDIEGQKTKIDNAQKHVLFKTALDKTIDDVVAEIQNHISFPVDCKLPPRLIAVFWMMSLYDIEVPNAAYEKTIENVRRQAREVMDSFELSKAKRTKEEERLRGLESKLREEQKRQTDHVERMRTWLDASKNSIFRGESKWPGGRLSPSLRPAASSFL